MKPLTLFTVMGIAAVSLSLTDSSIWSILLAAFPLFFSLMLKNIKLSVLLLVFFMLFYWRTELAVQSNVSNLAGTEDVLAGDIENGPYRDGDQAQIDLRTENREKILVTIPLKEYSELKFLPHLAPGMKCKVEGRLISPQHSTNFNQFDYSNYLKTQRIHWIFQAESISKLRCVEGASFSFLYLAKNWRHTGINWIDAYFPENLKGLAGALIFGDRHMLSSEIQEAYQKLGLIHLLAVSGLHVGIISASVYYLLLRMGMSRESTEWFLLLLLPFYMIITGAAPSVIRAVSILWFYIALKKCKIKIQPLLLLQIVALTVLFINPYLLVHVGFQLSFLISASLLLSWSIFKNRNKILQAFLVTIVAQFSALPILLYHFHEFSILGIILNLLFIPIIVFIVIPLLYSLFIISFVLPESTLTLSIPLSLLVAGAHDILRVSSSWDFLHLVTGKPIAVITCLLAIALFGMFYCMDKNGFGVKWMLSCMLAAFLLIIQILLPYVDPKGYITILDVGQGDSILIELPQRKGVYLIDGGGAIDFPKEEWEKRKKTYDPGESVVVPFLKSKGIRSIDKLIVSHGDADHFNGLYAVIEELKVSEVLYGRGETFKDEEKNFLIQVHSQHIPIQFVGRGDYWKHGEASFALLSPEGEEEPGNNRSIVIWAIIGGAFWLFTGDLEEEGEVELLRKYPRLHTDILKLGHHGSNTSTKEEFLEQIAPRAALISAGACNRFGHPHFETLENLKKHNVTVYRTDKRGAIQITFLKDRIINIENAASFKKSCE